MKRTALAKKNSRSNGSSKPAPGRRRLVVCVDNRDYPASLELRKIYQALPDDAGERLGMIRVIDESGEDYLFPEEYFLPVSLPKPVERAVLRAR